MESKTQLIQSLKKERQRWEDLLAVLSQGQITTYNRVEKLSIKDILAHLTTWQEVSVARMEAASYHRPPDYPGWHPEMNPETQEELGRINARIYSSRREQPWANVHQEWQERFLHFLELAESTPEEDLMESGKYEWLGEYPLSAVLLGSYEHHVEHLEPLLSLFQKAGEA